MNRKSVNVKSIQFDRPFVHCKACGSKFGNGKHGELGLTTWLPIFMKTKQSLIAEIVNCNAKLLSQHFKDRLILDVGSVNSVARLAKKLRLKITRKECSLVLDYIAEKAMVRITIDHVETAINELFNNRFIEP